MKSKFFFILFITTSVVIFIYLTLVFYRQAVHKPRLPVLGQVQNFTLYNSDGKEFSSRQLKGRVWIADFFFTTCSDICPMMTKHLSSIHQSLKIEKNVFLVSFTVNPEHDTPEVLAEYAKKLKADTKKWFFLTGPRDKITEIAVKSFKLGSMDEPVFHSSYFTLVDRYGLIRGYYDGMKQENLAHLLKDAAILLKDY